MSAQALDGNYLVQGTVQLVTPSALRARRQSGVRAAARFYLRIEFASRNEMNGRIETIMGTQDKQVNDLRVDAARSRQVVAEVERDIATGAALSEAEKRASAQNIAANERIRADQADFSARASAASAQAARDEASTERAAASNATFTASLVAIVAVAAIAVLAYFIWWQPSQQISTPTNTVIERTEKTTVPAAAQSTPSTINVAPPHVNVNVESPTPPVSSGAQTGASDGTSESGSGTNGENNSSNSPGSGGQ